MNKQVDYIYEIIIVDIAGKSEITTVKSLSNALAYSEKLWKDSVIKETAIESIIEDKVLGILLHVNKVDSSAQSNETAFILRVQSANFEEIEKFRQKLLLHIISKLGFVNAKVISDTVSEQISLSIYPLVKEVENTVRRNLTKVFLSKDGLSWWESNASKTVVDKVNQRKNVSNPFNQAIELSSSLTDFNDLSELIQKSPFSNSNFKSKWDSLGLIRDKVQTYAPLVVEDYTTAIQVSKELMSLLSENENRIEAVNLRTQNQKPIVAEAVTAPISAPTPVAPIIEAVKEAIVQAVAAPIVESKPVVEVVEQPVARVVEEVKPAPVYAPVVETVVQKVVVEKSISTNLADREPAIIGNEIISENEFIAELKKEENRVNGQKIELKTFVATVLANRGYATGYAYSLARSLNESGKVVLYETKDHQGLNIKAIKSV
jgi:hypothetical protein